MDNGFPPGYRALFDTVIRAAGHDGTGKMLYRVDLIDRYHDGPDVPQPMGSSDVFDDMGSALSWARGAIQTFRDG